MSWRGRARRSSASTKSCASSPATWWPKCARSTCCARARCWNSSPRKGLNPSAVHRTRLRVGEGLVGDIAAHARPLSLADAQSHPNFAYRPETGEEVYHSLMGVPILHSRPRRRRAGGAEPHPPPIRRGRDRDAADHRHGAGRAGGQWRTDQPQRGAPGRRHRPPAAAHRGRQAQWRARHGRWRCCTSRASSSSAWWPRTSPTELQRFNDGLAEVQDSIDVDAGSLRSGAWQRTSRDPRDLPHVRRGSRLGRPHLRGDRATA